MQLNLEPNFVQALLNYLATRPWGEVQGLIPPIVQEVEAAQQQAAQSHAGQHAGADEAGGQRVVPMHSPAA